MDLLTIIKLRDFYYIKNTATENIIDKPFDIPNDVVSYIMVLQSIFTDEDIKSERYLTVLDFKNKENRNALRKSNRKKTTRKRTRKNRNKKN
jgi:hypothetical protein